MSTASFPTAEESYRNGYDFGIVWATNVWPVWAEPEVLHLSYWEGRNDARRAHAQATKENNQRWRQGFCDARAAKLNVP